MLTPLEDLYVSTALRMHEEVGDRLDPATFVVLVEAAVVAALFGDLL